MIIHQCLHPDTFVIRLMKFIMLCKPQDFYFLVHSRITELQFTISMEFTIHTVCIWIQMAKNIDTSNLSFQPFEGFILETVQDILIKLGIKPLMHLYKYLSAQLFVYSFFQYPPKFRHYYNQYSDYIYFWLYFHFVTFLPPPWADSA